MWQQGTMKPWMNSALMRVSLMFFSVKESGDGPHFGFLPGDQRAPSGSDWGSQERKWKGGEGVCPGLPRTRQQTGGGKTLLRSNCYGSLRVAPKWFPYIWLATDPLVLATLVDPFYKVQSWQSACRKIMQVILFNQNVSECTAYACCV